MKKQIICILVALFFGLGLSFVTPANAVAGDKVAIGDDNNSRDARPNNTNNVPNRDNTDNLNNRYNTNDINNRNTPNNTSNITNPNNNDRYSPNDMNNTNNIQRRGPAFTRTSTMNGNNAPSYGWLGLVGLIGFLGLLGLRKRGNN